MAPFSSVPFPSLLRWEMGVTLCYAKVEGSSRFSRKCSLPAWASLSLPFSKLLEARV